ncbi:unnamed protein product [Caenorhabditis brenneri]
MPESLKNDDKSIRSYILNDVLEKVPIDKSYANLCKVIGNEAIPFYDFQFWYYRFLSGKQDLDFDRSSEPEPLQFSDLPVDAVGLIVDKLEIVERLMLRKVSKPLRDFMEKQEFDCTSIEINCGKDLISVWFGHRRILYTKNDEAVKTYKKVYEVRGAPILYGDESEDCDDLACVLKNPKLRIRRFQFCHMLSYVKAGVLSKFFDELKYALMSLKHQIAVRRLSLRPEHPDNFLAILPYLKPEYLVKLSIDGEGVRENWKSDENKRKIEQIIQLDQWKQAKELHLRDSLDLFPDEVLGQFERYRIRTLRLDQSQFDRFKMMFAASPVFEYCYLSVHQPSYDYGLDFIAVPGPINGNYRSICLYMIPYTDKVLVFKKFEYGYIEIEKKTRDDVQ